MWHTRYGREAGGGGASTIVGRMRHCCRYAARSKRSGGARMCACACCIPFIDILALLLAQALPSSPFHAQCIEPPFLPVRRRY